MGRCFKIALAIVFVALVGVIVREVAFEAREPVYMGRPLSSWLIDYDVWRDGAFALGEPVMPQPEAQRADEAVRHTGTNAIPTLLRLLRARDSALKVKLLGLAQHQRMIIIKPTVPPFVWNAIAVREFGVLGAQAQSAVPELINIADKSISSNSRCRAIEALGAIGPAAKEAVPALLRWATDAEPALRSYARQSLRKIDPEAAARAGVK